MAGKKRTRNGQVKLANTTQQPHTAIPAAEPTPPCGQPQLPSSTTTESQNSPQLQASPREYIVPEVQTSKLTESAPTASSNPNAHSKNKSTRQKHPRLPNNAIISKRPLLHPAIPTPFASSASPKILYITATSPFIPTIKRIRKLLSEVDKREKQSQGAQRGKRKGRPEANGRLTSGDVERGMADELAKAREANRGGIGEKVYLKATGRAIPRALELGVKFQEEGDCVVKVEMGSVKAIDDIEVQSKGGAEEDGIEGVEEGYEMPETRIRTISSVTVSIGLK